MNKKDSKKQSMIPIIIFFLFIFVGCLLMIIDNIPKRGSETPPEYLPLQIQGWESQIIETVCLEVNQSYPKEWFGFFKEMLVSIGVNLTPRQFEFPYEEIIGEILQRIDVEVVNDSAQCDAELIMSFTGTDSSSTYGNIITKRGNSICYAGSSVSGVLLLKAENQEEFTTSVWGSVSTPEVVYSSNCPDQPYDAPFEESSAEALTDGLVQLWGPEIAEIIRSLYRTGYDYEEAMYDAANDFLKGGETTKPTFPAAEPTTETIELSP